ncbi:hypothetical protein ACTG9Q_28085 [Actinokineospora sp. 24-640]
MVDLPDRVNFANCVEVSAFAQVGRILDLVWVGFCRVAAAWVKMQLSVSVDG